MDFNLLSAISFFILMIVVCVIVIDKCFIFDSNRFSHRIEMIDNFFRQDWIYKKVHGGWILKTHKNQDLFVPFDSGPKQLEESYMYWGYWFYWILRCPWREKLNHLRCLIGDHPPVYGHTRDGYEVRCFYCRKLLDSGKDE